MNNFSDFLDARRLAGDTLQIRLVGNDRIEGTLSEVHTDYIKIGLGDGDFHIPFTAIISVLVVV